MGLVSDKMKVYDKGEAKEAKSKSKHFPAGANQKSNDLKKENQPNQNYVKKESLSFEEKIDGLQALLDKPIIGVRSPGT